MGLRCNIHFSCYKSYHTRLGKRSCAGFFLPPLFPCVPDNLHRTPQHHLKASRTFLPPLCPWGRTEGIYSPWYPESGKQRFFCSLVVYINISCFSIRIIMYFSQTLIKMNSPEIFVRFICNFIRLHTMLRFDSHNLKSVKIGTFAILAPSFLPASPRQFPLYYSCLEG